MIGEGVAPQERLRIGGARSHDGHPRELWAVGAEQRQHGPGVEQNDRSFGELTRDGPVLRRVEVDAGGVAHGRLGRPISVKQAELGLLGQQPPRGAVDERFRDVAAGDGIDQSLAVADPVGQFDVDAGRQRMQSSLGGVGRYAVHRREERHGAGEIAFWRAMLAAATQTAEWRSELQRHFWTEMDLDGAELPQYLERERTDMRAVLAELGLLAGGA